MANGNPRWGAPRIHGELLKLGIDVSQANMIVFNEAGLLRLMTLYCSYYERSRTHLSLDKDTPIPRPIMPLGEGAIVAIPEVGGLHHRYERRAA